MSESQGESGADAQRPPEVTTLLGQGSAFSGKLNFDGAVRIDGHFSGEIESDGTLVVGAAAEIEADITVRNVLIQGKVVGNVTAEESIEIHAPARVNGTLTCPELSIEKGVLFDGSCDMSKKAGAPAVAKASAKATATKGAAESEKKASGGDQMVE